MWGACGQLRGVTLERNGPDYSTNQGDMCAYYAYNGGKIVADGVERG